MSRLMLRRIGAGLCGVMAAVYVLIGLEVVTIGTAGDADIDIGVFGFGAASIFVLGAVLLLAVDRKVLWGLGAAFQLMMMAMYVGVSADRTPAFEAWGLGLRVPQVLLFAVLVALVVRPASARGATGGDLVVDPVVAEEFLSQPRLAVVGVSDDPGNFGRTVYRELREHGRDVVAVHPTADSVLDDPAYPDLASVPGPIDGVVLMVPRDRAVEVVEQAIGLGVPRVWFFRGVGGAGAVSPEAVAAARAAGMAVVPGACPLMFLEPVGSVHRLHRGIRRLDGSLAPTG